MFVWIERLSLAGIILAVYLLWEQFFKPTFNPCNVNSTVNCEAIISGMVAKTFGLPTPLIGLIGYIVIFISAIKKYKRMALGMASFGLLFCLYIGFIELFKLHTICPVCIGCEIIMISIFILSCYNLLWRKNLQ